MCGSTNSLTDDEPPPGFRTRATSRSARSWSGISPSTVISTARVEAVVGVRGATWASPSAGTHVGDAAPVGLAHHVIEHLLLDVEDVDLPAVKAAAISKV